MISIKQAAKATNKSESGIYYISREGYVKTSIYRGKILVCLESLKKYFKKSKPGRKKNEGSAPEQKKLVKKLRVVLRENRIPVKKFLEYAEMNRARLHQIEHAVCLARQDEINAIQSFIAEATNEHNN